MRHFANIFCSLWLFQLGLGAAPGQATQLAVLEPTAPEHRGSRSTAVDSVYSDFPYIKRVYNWGAGEARGPSVPFVELDTNTYDKKLWLSEKKVLSQPIRSKQGQVVALDSVVYVAYSVYDGTTNLYSTFSLDYGATWTSPYFIQETGQTSGKSLLIDEERVNMAYSVKLEGAFEWEMLFRKTDTGFAMISDSIVVDTTSSSSKAVYGPSLVSWDDTLFLSYFHYHNWANYFRFTKSDDQGDSWSLVSGDVLTAAGIPHFFLLTDSVLSEVYQSGSNEIHMHRSFDGGLTWPEELYLSAIDQYASQIPAASTDGISDIHVVWYDHDGAPPGSGGYIFYRRTVDNGQAWDEIKSLSTEGHAERADIRADTNYVYAVWNDSRFGSPDYALYLRYSHDRGQSWSPEIMVVDSTDPAWDPDVYAWEDYFYLVWREQHPPDWVWGIYYIFGAWYLPGDVDHSDAINVSDLTYLVNYLFRGGDQPFIPDAAQMDGKAGINIADLTYLVSYLFRGGPPPIGGTPGL